MKNNQRKVKGKIEDFNFLMTINLMRAPETRIAIKLLINHASGRTITSVIVIIMEIIIAKVTISVVLSIQIERISVRYPVIATKVNTMTIQNVIYKSF